MRKAWRWLAPLLFVATPPLATPVQAKPSLWARARDPELARQHDAIKAADRALSQDYTLSRTPSAFRRGAMLRKTQKMLARANAVAATNAELRYRLAQVHYRLFDMEDDLGHIEAAAEHFEYVALDPRMPQMDRARALMSLAICYARLGRHEDEIEAYNRAIALQPDPISHAVLLANQAEGYMARGRIIAALHGYRQSLEATPSPFMIDSGVTTMWGLAVALDRSGDLGAAIENVRRARSYDPGDRLINGSHWFYVPPYDRYWYEALGHWQIARDAKDPAVVRLAYTEAIRSWRTFTEMASATDPWLAIAGFRTQQCEKELLEAMARLAKTHVDTEPKRADPLPKDPSLWPTP